MLGTALGLFVSAFAETEFQAVQFMPAVVIPQILLCGLFVARDELPDVLAGVSDLLPLSYAVDGMQSCAQADRTSECDADLPIVAAFARRSRRSTLECRTACGGDGRRASEVVNTWG